MKVLLMFLASCLFVTSVFSQTSGQARHPGVVLFEQAKYSEAVRSLEKATKQEHKSDGEIWNYLGLAYLAKNELKKSRKAFEKSVGLNPRSPIFRSNLAFAYLMNGQVNRAQESATTTIELDPNNAQAYQVRSTALAWEGKLDAADRDADSFIRLASGNADAYILKSEILLAKLAVRVGSGNAVREEIGYLKRAFDTLTLGIANAKTHRRYAELEKEAESVGAFYRHFSRDPVVPPVDPPLQPPPGVTPVRIISKPHARYTDAARTNNISGTVRVVALFGASGRVEQVLLIKRLGYGLDQEAVNAVRQVRFEPKKIDGKPVSTVMTFEYGFTIY